MPLDKHDRPLTIPARSFVNRPLAPSDFTIYPAYCHKASPTYFAWVKLTIYDVQHVLVIRPEFSKVSTRHDVNSDRRQNDTLLLFYLNHPIQFVQLVGVIVAFEDYFNDFWLFTVDDSSGATIEVNCRKPVPRQSSEPATSKNGDSLVKKKKKDDGSTIDAEEMARISIVQKLDIGKVVQVKGRITTFRNVRQLQLDRIILIQTTNQEMQLIAARTAYWETTLSKPWTLDASKQQKLRDEAHGETGKETARADKLKRRKKEHEDRERRHARKIEKEYEVEERKRKAGADETRLAGETLKKRRDNYNEIRSLGARVDRLDDLVNNGVDESGFT